MKLFFGGGLLITGLALIFFNKPIAHIQERADKLFGVGSVSQKFNRLVFYVVGILLSSAGILVLSGFFRVES